jgi:site-specific DNA recombinase
MKARLYIRVSTDEQVEGYSLEVQEERCRSFALSQGWAVEGLTPDEGYSGYYTNRPGLNTLLRDAKEKLYDVIVVYKLDRFSRKLKDLLNITEQLEEYGVGLKSVTEPFDTLTSHGKLQFQILGSFAGFGKHMPLIPVEQFDYIQVLLDNRADKLREKGWVGWPGQKMCRLRAPAFRRHIL